MSYDFPFTKPNIQNIYQQKLKSASEAIAQFADELKFVTFGCYAATPVALTQAYANAAKIGLLKNVIDTYLFRSSAEVVNFLKTPKLDFY